MTGFREIAAHLRAAIERGDYPPGSQIPTEHELARQYRVSRETISRALTLLKSAGLLASRTSQGTFVTEPAIRLPVSRYSAVVDPNRELNDLGPWEVACAQHGVAGWTEMVNVDQQAAPPHVAARFGVGLNVEAIHRRRRMWADDQIAQIQDSWIPVDIAEGTILAGPAKVVGGIYAAMVAAGVDLATVTEEIAARMPVTDEQAMMRLAEAIPVLDVWRSTFDRQGRVVEVLHIVADSRRSMFVYENLPLRYG